jgi:hypothetical protein
MQYTRIYYRLDNRRVRVQTLVKSRIVFASHHPYWLWAHPASYQRGTWGFFSEGNVARALS